MCSGEPHRSARRASSLAGFSAHTISQFGNSCVRMGRGGGGGGEDDANVNTLKPLVIFAVLVGVCYGVYSRINHKSDRRLPPEAAGDWEGSPNIEMGDAQGGPAAQGRTPGDGAAPCGYAPLMAIAGGGQDPNARGYEPRGQDFVRRLIRPGNWNAPPAGGATGPGVDYTVGGDPTYNPNPQAGVRPARTRPVILLHRPIPTHARPIRALPADMAIRRHRAGPGALRRFLPPSNRPSASWKPADWPKRTINCRAGTTIRAFVGRRTAPN